MISWLTSQVNSLWNWVRELSSRISGAYNNAVAWARTAIDAAINGVVGLIKSNSASILRTAEDWIVSRANTLEASLVRLINTTFGKASKEQQGLIDTILAQLKRLERSISDVAQSVVKAAFAPWLWALDQARLFFADPAGYLFARIEDLGHLFAFFKRMKYGEGDPLSFLFKLLSPDNMRVLLDLLGRVYQFLWKLLDDPIGVIISFLGDILIDLVFDLLATGMGTVKYTLPPPMKFGKYGTYFRAGGVLPLPGAPGALGKPLARLYVSGYVFGPGHPGIDFGVVMGEPVYAAHDGTVDYAGWSAVGYGFTITLGEREWWTRYAHLARVAVRPGQRVSRGQHIGDGDDTGNSSGPHLHFEVKHNGGFVNPAPLYGL